MTTTRGPGLPAARADLIERLRVAELLGLDFDGILTNGLLYVHESGQVSKAVSYLDIVGVTRWRRLGHGLCIISGDGESGIPEHYAKAFKVPKLYTGRQDKLDAFREAAEDYGIALEHAVYMGDDVMDIDAMVAAAVGATVPTAHPHVLEHADWISTQPAGAGAVRELIDLALAAQGHHVTELRPRPAGTSDAPDPRPR